MTTENDNISLVACFTSKNGILDVQSGVFHLDEGGRTACGIPYSSFTTTQAEQEFLWRPGRGPLNTINCIQCLSGAAGTRARAEVARAPGLVLPEELSLIGRLFPVFPHERYVRVQLLPFLYPDGDIVDLFVLCEETGITVTDRGEALRWIRTTDHSLPLEQVKNLRSSYGIDFARGVLFIRLSARDEPFFALLRLAQMVVVVTALAQRPPAQTDEP